MKPPSPSSPLLLLGRILVGLLKFVVQLLLLLVTGSWVKFGEEQPEAGLPPGTPAAAEAGREGPRGDERARRGAQAQGGTFSQDKTRSPERAQLVSHVKRLVAQQPSDVRVQLMHLSAFAQRSFHELEVSMRGYGLPLRKRAYVALSTVSAADEPQLVQAAEHSPQAAFVVGREGLDNSLEPYLEAMRFRAEMLAEDSYLIARLRRDYRLPKADPNLVRLLAGNNPSQRQQAMLALWLRPLVAELLLSLRLGPSYVAYLMRGLEARNARGNAVDRAPATASKPPLVLRIEMALQALMYTGAFEVEVSALERSVDESLGSVAVFSVADPSVVGRLEVPLAVFRAQALSIIDTVLDSDFPGLGDVTLFELPGVALPEPDHAGALVQVREVTGGEQRPDAAVEDLMLRALVQVTARRQAERDAARWLRETLGYATPKKGARDLPGVTAQALGRPPILSVKSALRDPAVLRDAVVLGALMGTRQPVLRGRGARRRPS